MDAQPITNKTIDPDAPPRAFDSGSASRAAAPIRSRRWLSTGLHL
jgi:hypothetical protein